MVPLRIFKGRVCRSVHQSILRDIFICFKSKFSNEWFEKPFQNVEKVKFGACCLSAEDLPNFINWFPKMRSLEMLACTIADTKPINIIFPHLENLKIYIKGNNFFENVMRIIKSNPQLQSLEILTNFEMTLDLLLNKISGNSTISNLFLNIGIEQMDIIACELDRLVTKHPLVVELVLKRYRLAANDVIKFIRRMKLLKKIKFYVRSRSECERIMTELGDQWKSNVSNDDGKFYIELNC